MGPIAVSDVGDPRLVDFARIGRERELSARGLFVAEGRLVLSRLLAARPELVRAVLCNEAALAALGPQLAGLAAPVYVCAPRFFEGLTGHHFHRGCLALAERPISPDPLQLARGARSLLVLERVADPDNVGSVFRSARAFGVDAVWLGHGTADALSRKAIRTSVAATLQLPFALLQPEPEDPAGAGAFCHALRQLLDLGFELCALTPNEPSLPLGSLGPAGARRALLIGSEGDGLSDAALALATQRVRIEMRPGVDSLNLGVAAGIALHALSPDRSGA